MTVTSPADIDFNPLDRIRSRSFEGRRRILGRLSHRASMSHDLNAASRLNRLEEREPLAREQGTHAEE